MFTNADVESSPDTLTFFYIVRDCPLCVSFPANNKTQRLYIFWYNICTSISIGNSIVSSAIWKKHARVSFSKTTKTARVRRTSAIWCLWKTHEWMFFQIARETILLLINKIHEKITRFDNSCVYSPTPFKHCFHSLLANFFSLYVPWAKTCYIHKRFSIESVQKVVKKLKITLLILAATLIFPASFQAPLLFC